MVAALTVYTAARVVKGKEAKWNATMIKNTGYKPKAMHDLSKDLIIYVQRMRKSKL